MLRVGGTRKLAKRTKRERGKKGTRNWEVCDSRFKIWVATYGKLGVLLKEQREKEEEREFGIGKYAIQDLRFGVANYGRL